MSEEKTIYQRLSEIQRALKAPKNQYNNFGNYYYRSCEDILEGVKPLLQEGETITFSDKPCLVGDWHYIEATAIFSLHSESISVTGYAREPETKKGMDDSQITGTASSYARKYAANALLCIDDTKDADTMDNKMQSQKKPVQQNSQPRQQKAQGGRPFEEALDWLDSLQAKPPQVIEKSWLAAQTFLGNTYSAEQIEKLKTKYNQVVSKALEAGKE